MGLILNVVKKIFNRKKDREEKQSNNSTKKVKDIGTIISIGLFVWKAIPMIRNGIAYISTYFQIRKMRAEYKELDLNDEIATIDFFRKWSKTIIDWSKITSFTDFDDKIAEEIERVIDENWDAFYQIILSISQNKTIGLFSIMEVAKISATENIPVEMIVVLYFLLKLNDRNESDGLILESKSLGDAPKKKYFIKKK